jgi:hypothetical protein
MHFISLLARSRTALAAENLFLRKQLAFYQERKVVPRHSDNVTPKTFIGWHRAGFCLFWRYRIARDLRVSARPVLGGLHRDYRLVSRMMSAWIAHG